MISVSSLTVEHIDGDLPLEQAFFIFNQKGEVSQSTVAHLTHPEVITHRTGSYIKALPDRLQV